MGADQTGNERIRKNVKISIKNSGKLQDGQVLDIEGIKVECIMVPGHTWGHMVYLVDEAYLFTGDTIWFGPDGGRSFLNVSMYLLS